MNMPPQSRSGGIELSVEDIDRARRWLTRFVKQQDVPLINALCDKAMLGALSEVPSVAGWKLVPVEPTAEMMRVAIQRGADGHYNEGIWKAMIEAAPHAPRSESTRQEPPGVVEIIRMQDELRAAVSADSPIKRVPCDVKWHCKVCGAVTDTYHFHPGEASAPASSERSQEPVAWMEYDRDGRAIGATTFKPDGFWPFKPLYLAPDSAKLAPEPAAWLEIDKDGDVIGVSRQKDPFSPFRWEPVYRASRRSRRATYPWLRQRGRNHLGSAARPLHALAGS